jgi:branched-chain amino acid aminotransferase
MIVPVIGSVTQESRSCHWQTTIVMKAWIDNEIVDAELATLPVLDHGLLYGDGVFEGIRIAHRRIFRLADHIQRLRVSASAIGLRLPQDDAFLTNVVVATAKAHGSGEAYVRLIVTRGVGALGVDPSTCATPSLICIVGPIVLFPEEKRRHGLALATSSLRRPAFDTLDPRVESLNYLNNVMAKAEALRAGADEALVLNQAGRVVEASVANVFAARDEVLLTPHPNEGALAGLTRQTVIEHARAEGIEVVEGSMTRVDLLAADEVFLTGSGAGLIAVATLDGQPIGKGVESRSVTERMANHLDQARRTMGEEF